MEFDKIIRRPHGAARRELTIYERGGVRRTVVRVKDRNEIANRTTHCGPGIPALLPERDIVNKF